MEEQLLGIPSSKILASTSAFGSITFQRAVQAAQVLGYPPFLTRTRLSPYRVDSFLWWRHHFNLIRRGQKSEDFEKERHCLGNHQVLQFRLFFLFNRYRAVGSCRRNQVYVFRSQKATNGEHSSDCCACRPFLGSRKLRLYSIMKEI